MRPGNNKFVFQINGTDYCDQSLPIVHQGGQQNNNISLWSDCHSPIMSLSSKVQISMNWKVQLVGNWSTEYENVLDCKVSTSQKSNWKLKIKKNLLVQ